MHTQVAPGAAPPIAQIVRGGPEIVDQLADLWRGICLEGPSNQPFFRPEWISAYARAFASSNQLTVIVARDEFGPTALLPLVRSGGRWGVLPSRGFRSAANVHSARFDLVHLGGQRGEAGILTIWRAIQHLPGWDVLDFCDVPEGSGVEKLLRLADADGYPNATRISLRSPYVPLAGAGHDLNVVLQRTTAKFRSNLRRRMRKLEERGPVRLERVDHAEPEVLERFYALEQAGWKGTQGTAIACDARVRQFYDDVARSAEKNGYLALYTLWCGEHPVAMHFGLALGGRYFIPKVAFDEAFSEYSPGQLIVLEVLRDLAERGFQEFDFLGPNMPWKQDWSPETRAHLRCYIFRRSPVGMLFHLARFRFLPILRARLRARQA